MGNKFTKFLSTTFCAVGIFVFTSPFAMFLNPQIPGPVMAETGSSVIWTVKDGDTMLDIAKEYYGDPNYWTTIWNDNPWIDNPWIIETGWALEMRNHVPTQPQVLDPELMQRLSRTTYFYYPEVQNHPMMQEVKMTQTASLNTQVQGIQAELIQSVPTVTPVITQAQSAPAPVTYTGGPLSEAQITFLGNCEAGMNPTRNSGNGYYGAFQFSYGTWKRMNTGYERADLAPLDVQKDAVQRLVQRSSIYHQFPGCSAKMHAAGLL